MYRKLIAAAVLASTTMMSQAALAQDASPATPASGDLIGQNGTFRGFRAEVQGGRDWFHSQGTHDGKLAFGGALGFDGQFDKFVVGPEVSYWRSRDENVTAGVAGGQVRHKSFNEIGAGIRAGYLVTPQVLLYGIGGYVNDEQRKAFISPAANGAGSYYNHVTTDGYQLGVGGEYSLTDLFYVGAGYRYAKYDDHTRRDRLFLSAGIRFKP